MEATATYPQWPPVLVSTGLGGAIAAPSPDRIPLQPVMVNDPRERARTGGVDCVGILRECHRNLAGYNFARPLKRTQFKDVHNSGAFARTEAMYFDRHNREFVPRDMTVELLQPEISRERESDLLKWQGNALLGVALPASQDHAVFLPAGQILQQARVFRNFSRDRKRQRLSNAVECGAVIRQFELLGSREAYEMYGTSTMRVAARGAANCTILEASFGGDSDEDDDSLRALHRLRFDAMLYHITGSPHTENDLAFVTGDGKVHTWNSIGGVHSLHMNAASVDERLLRCEYASHPCVLWTANRVRVQTLDLREPQATQVSLFDLVKMNAPNSEIYALKRRERAPFQFAVGTSVSVELLDSRMPGKALLSWQQRHEIDSKIPYFGALDEIHWGGNNSGSDKGIILTSTQGRKTVSLYPFIRHDDAPSNIGSSPYLSIAPLRSIVERSHPTGSQYIATDSPLDLQLRDGSDWTTLFGFCALADDANAATASVYQLSSMGDLFCQQIRPSTNGEMYETAVQTELPCGVTAQHHPDDGEGTQLPLPADAIEGDYASDALTPFVALPLHSFMEAFPRLSAAHESANDESAIRSLESHEIMTALRHACRPSATLFRLHRFVNEELGLCVSSQVLLQMLRSHAEFSVRNGYHRLRQRTATVLDPFPTPLLSLEMRVRQDERLAMCACSPQTAHEPCESVACVVPHALIVTSGSYIYTGLCFPTAQADEDACSDDYAAILDLAHAAYGQRH